MQKQNGEDWYPDEHGAVDDAGFRRRKRAERMIPDGEGKGRVDNGEPGNDGPASDTDVREPLNSDTGRKQHYRADAHADDGHDEGMHVARTVDIPAEDGSAGVGGNAED